MARMQVQRKTKRWQRTGLGGAVLALLGAFLILQQAVALTGSSFEILDGNESVEDAAKLDWSSAEVVAGQTVLPDESQTATDESISGSEDDTSVVITAGSIQPNKSDIVKVRKFSKKENGLDFLYLAFDRFPTTNGVMAIDFELNQKSQGTVPAPGGTWNLNRTAGDKLLVFEMVNGGTVPIISMMTWVTGAGDDCEKNGQVAPCWGTKQLLTPDTNPAAEGSVNQTGNIVFGEMAINLEAAGVFKADACTSFASLYAKSRSSGSSLANQISDLVKPKETTISNCGSVTVEKKVTGPTVAGDATSFQFTVSCPDADLDPVLAGKQTSIEFDLAHNGSRKVNDVPIGSTCTVTEAAPSPDNFTTTYTVTGVAGTSSGRVATVADVPLTGRTVTFTNARKTGGLDITKTSTGGVGTFLFTVDCTGTAYDLTGADKVSITTTTAGTPVTSPDITGIPTGTVCTVTEDANPLYSTVVTPSNGQRTIDTTIQNVSFSNTRKVATLTVDKLTTGGTGTFLFAVDCNDGTAHDRTGGDKLSISNTGTAQVTGIPTGTSCTVTEDPNALFTSSLRAPSVSNTVEIGDAGGTVYFQNVRKTGTLTVAKTTTGGTGTFRFEVDCSDNAFDRLGDDRLTIVGSGSATITGIPTGVTCTVTETTDPLFTSTRTPADGQVTIDENGETVTFSNVRNTGTLTVSKTTTGGTGTFRFEVDCTDDAFDRLGDDRLTITDSGSATIVGIPTGVTCTVTESPNALFTSTRTPTNGTVVMDSDGETVSFTNVRKVGTLTVAKTTTGGTGTFRFTVDCSDDAFDRTGDARLTVVDSGTATIGNIPTGTTCTVTETDDARFTSTRTPTNGTVTIDEDGETVSFVNVRKTGTLTVAKTTTGGTGTFRFEVDCTDDAFDRTGDARLTVVDSGTATITGIPTGVTCTVTETPNPLFTSTRSPLNGTVTIDVDGETVSFTNVRKTGDLTITKTATGGDGSFSFAVDCSDDAFDRAAVVVTTTGGSGSVVITGIPTTVTCTIVETVPVGWAAVGGATRNVTIDADGETAAFVNRKLLSGINVTKVASAPVVHNGASATYTYVVTNTGENPLDDVVVVDDKCSTVTGPAGDTGADGILGLTESWTYTCTSTLTTTTTNVVTATGTDPLDAEVTDTATATVTVINPKITIVKTPSATSVSPGTTVVYTYTVTNPGDVPLTAVSVADDKCSPVTLLSGDVNGDAILQTTETWVFRCSQVQTGAVDTLTNIGTARGTDPLGQVITSNDTVTVAVVAPLVITQPTVQAVVIAAPAPAPAPVAVAPVTLPRTGIDVNGWIQLGASLILLGVALLVTGRNRRRTA